MLQLPTISRFQLIQLAIGLDQSNSKILTSTHLQDLERLNLIQRPKLEIELVSIPKPTLKVGKISIVCGNYWMEQATHLELDISYMKGGVLAKIH